MARTKIRKHGLLLDGPLDDPERCRSCGGACCSSFSSVELSWEEYIRLREFGAVRLELTLTGRCLLLIDEGCEFLDNGRCSIYEERPLICRRFYCEEK